MVGKVDVLLCRVGEVAEVVEIENCDEGVAALLQVEDMENLSYITPWSQDVMVVFNEKARVANRRLYAEQGEDSVVVSGDFIVALMPRGCSEFLPMPRMVVDRYSKLMEVIQ